MELAPGATTMPREDFLLILGADAPGAPDSVKLAASLAAQGYSVLVYLESGEVFASSEPQAQPMYAFIEAVE